MASPLEQQKRRYDRFWQQKQAKRERTLERIRLCLPHLLPHAPGPVLEVGCGSGEGSSFLQSQGFEVLGVDISQKALQEARKKGIPTQEGDITHLKLSRTFPLILCLEVLEHLLEPEKAFLNLLSHLTPQGKLFLSLPNDFHFLQNLGLFPKNPWHLHRFSLSKGVKFLSLFPIQAHLIAFQPLFPSPFPLRNWFAQRFPTHFALSFLFLVQHSNKKSVPS